MTDSEDVKDEAEAETETDELEGDLSLDDKRSDDVAGGGVKWG